MYPVIPRISKISNRIKRTVIKYKEKLFLLCFEAEHSNTLCIFGVIKQTKINKTKKIHPNFNFSNSKDNILNQKKKKTMNLLESLSACFWFSPENKRNTFASILAGVLFFSGWWFLIDAISVGPHDTHTPLHIVLGIMGTISLIMVNSVTQAQINGDVAMSGGCLEARGARIWIFVGFVLGFAAIIAAVWQMIANFSDSESKDNKSYWPAISLLLQNVFIFLGSLVFKFGRSEDQWT